VQELATTEAQTSLVVMVATQPEQQVLAVEAVAGLSLGQTLVELSLMLSLSQKAARAETAHRAL